MNNSPRITRILPLAAVLLAGVPESAAAQVVRGTVVEHGAGHPIRGALVLLLDQAGTQLAGGLTDARGAFSITAPAAGRYRVSVQRIGYADGVVPELALGVGETIEHVVALRQRAIDLGHIVVEARRRCTVRPQEGLLVAQLWDEAKKALVGTAFSQRQRIHGYRVRGYRRELGMPGMRVLHDSAAERTMHSGGSPYRSAPIGALLARGFVQDTLGERHYFAPDAHALLSDEFLDAYCFRLTPRHADDARLVGIAFEPVDRHGPPAVRGTLWLDRESYELRWLEYGYTRSRWPHDEDRRVGGRVEFEMMANGTWIVRRWWIRMPAGLREASAEGLPVAPRRAVLSSIVEEGGVVLATLSQSPRLARRDDTEADEPLADTERDVVAAADAAIVPVAADTPAHAAGDDEPDVAAADEPAPDSAAVVTLEPLEAVTRSTITTERRTAGTRVSVMTRRDIDAHAAAARNIGDIARRLPGITARDVYYRNSSTLREICLESGRGAVTMANQPDADCPGRILIVLDGVPMPDGSILVTLSPTSVESIQYLDSIEGGRRFGSAAARGVLLIYTRGNGPFVTRDGG